MPIRSNDELILCDGPYVTDPDASPMSGEATVLYHRAPIRSRAKTDKDAGPLGSGHSPMRDTANESEADGGSAEEPSTHLIHGPASLIHADGEGDG